jgi:D-alanine-D-alanine ligase
VIAAVGGAGDAPKRSEAKRVAVLQGGRSLERGVSLRSGAQVQDALQRLGHDTVAIDAGAELVAKLRAAKPDAVFVAMHGGDGEDGTVQELLEAVGVPYTGSGPAACVQCSDKVLAKHLMRAAGIPTPDFHAFSEASFKQLGGAATLADVGARLGFPLVVKPACQGSALGVRFARAAAEVPGALVAAFSYDRKVLIERHVAGRDLAVSVLACPPAGPSGGRVLQQGGSSTEDPREGDGATAGPRQGDGATAGDGPEPSPTRPTPLPVVEAVPREENFYDFESRYEIGRTTFVCPAELSPQTTARAQELALEAYRLLGCHGYARVDLMLDEASGELAVLETNVVPGLTATSLLPQAADAAGIGFDELVARILDSAFTR